MMKFVLKIFYNTFFVNNYSEKIFNFFCYFFKIQNTAKENIFISYVTFTGSNIQFKKILKIPQTKILKTRKNKLKFCLTVEYGL